MIEQEFRNFMNSIGLALSEEPLHVANVQIDHISREGWEKKIQANNLTVTVVEKRMDGDTWPSVSIDMSTLGIGMSSCSFSPRSDEFNTVGARAIEIKGNRDGRIGFTLKFS
jgi:hypothetical protein